MLARTRQPGLLFLLVAVLASMVRADPVEIEIDDDLSVPLYRYSTGDASRPAVLWLPPEQGIQSPMHAVAESVAESGVEVWIADLHTAYFVDVGRSSVDAFKAGDVARLIDALHQRTGREVIVLAGNRMSVTALRGIRALQQSDLAMSVRGAILLSPTLYRSPETPGLAATWLPVARATNVPVFVIQPEIGVGTMRVDSALEILRSGGSTVFIRLLKGVQGGYLVRTDHDLTPRDFRARDEASALLLGAVDLLRKLPAPRAAADMPAERGAEDPREPLFGLKPIAGKPPTSLDLEDVRGDRYALSSHLGNVVLISFWASWCSPCLEELPALARLNRDFSARGLTIVTVNVGEDPETIRAVAGQFDMLEYALLRDPEGAEMKRWNVYGFPTNFLIGRGGALKFGSFGAVDWDDAAVRQQVTTLFD